MKPKRAWLLPFSHRSSSIEVRKQPNLRNKGEQYLRFELFIQIEFFSCKKKKKPEAEKEKSLRTFSHIKQYRQLQNLKPGILFTFLLLLLILYDISLN